MEYAGSICLVCLLNCVTLMMKYCNEKFCLIGLKLIKDSPTYMTLHLCSFTLSHNLVHMLTDTAIVINSLFLQAIRIVKLRKTTHCTRVTLAWISICSVTSKKDQ